MTHWKGAFNRPPGFINYYGGKWHLAEKIAQLLQRIPHKIYIEPFGGAAHVLMAKTPSPIEVINDKDEWIADLFRVVSDRKLFSRFRRIVRYIPYHRAFWNIARMRLLNDPSDDIVERAADFFIAQCMNLRGAPLNARDAWRFSITTVKRESGSWFTRLRILGKFHQRLRNVTVQCVDALDCINLYDDPESLFYIDPPYLVKKQLYRYSMTLEQTDGLLKRLVQLKGKAVMSFYWHPLFRRITERGWLLFARPWYAATYVARRETSRRKQPARGEHLALNPAPVAALGGESHAIQIVQDLCGFHPVVDLQRLYIGGEENCTAIARAKAGASSVA